MGIFLGLWHTYKQLNLLLWKTFLSQFFGSLYHVICPSQLVFIKPTLTQVIVFLTMLRLCYPSIATTLEESLNYLKSKPPFHPHLKFLPYLLNFKDIFTFWIPLVSSYYDLNYSYSYICFVSYPLFCCKK